MIRLTRLTGSPAAECLNRAAIRALVLSLLLIATLTLAPPAHAAAPEPGPENGGIRLRLVVSPRSDGKKGFDVQADLLNVADRDLTLRAEWEYEFDQGGVEEYLEAAIGFETYPPLPPLFGGTASQSPRISDQPEYVLSAGEVLSLKWQTEGWKIKNRRIGLGPGQNAEFALSGLYSVHALIRPIVNGEKLLLRSNEQLVSVGGSNKSPRHAFGRLWSADQNTSTARLHLGFLHGVRLGDEFQVIPAKGGSWKLTITDVELEYSSARIEPFPVRLEDGFPERRFPQRDTMVVLIPKQ